MSQSCSCSKVLTICLHKMLICSPSTEISVVTLTVRNSAITFLGTEACPFSGPGAQTPELCPAGHFCLPGTTFSTEHPCPKGTFGPRAGATSESDCEPCPAGMYCTAPGLSQPSGFCYPGYHCAKGAISPAPFKHRVDSSSPALPGNDICPVGHFCPRGTGHPLPCPPGSLSSALGLGAEEQCQPCPPGRVCSGPGLAELAQTSLCDPGYVCLEGNSSPCPSDGIRGYRCPSGSYCPAGSGLELPCEPGTFSPMPGASSCLPCPAGTSCGRAGTVQPLTCPRGYFCPGRTAVPVPCPEGTMSPLEGALAPTACRQCPVGSFCRGEANWEPDAVDPWLPSQRALSSGTLLSPGNSCPCSLPSWDPQQCHWRWLPGQLCALLPRGVLCQHRAQLSHWTLLRGLLLPSQLQLRQPHGLPVPQGSLLWLRLSLPQAMPCWAVPASPRLCLLHPMPERILLPGDSDRGPQAVPTPFLLSHRDTSSSHLS
ncbi:multiple epidermal growth factor-like domains protein 6 [Oenanthe melanoleuca]|uniref:multiple epidermal growth factor-like domains protein 6 n=1 Tax=Oenanthe melanoleuca TaxID=2939378 RepID=UPI0024C17CA6|nr:multiple epidermal growth factor-like domains protein 6 [Oenanthe melanoleuca]